MSTCSTSLRHSWGQQCDRWRGLHFALDPHSPGPAGKSCSLSSLLSSPLLSPVLTALARTRVHLKPLSFLQPSPKASQESGLAFVAVSSVTRQPLFWLVVVSTISEVPSASVPREDTELFLWSLEYLLLSPVLSRSGFLFSSDSPHPAPKPKQKLMQYVIF